MTSFCEKKIACNFSKTLKFIFKAKLEKSRRQLVINFDKKMQQNCRVVHEKKTRRNCISLFLLSIVNLISYHHRIVIVVARERYINWANMCTLFESETFYLSSCQDVLFLINKIKFEIISRVCERKLSLWNNFHLFSISR
jgi:hypothetical protein